MIGRFEIRVIALTDDPDIVGEWGEEVVFDADDIYDHCLGERVREIARRATEVARMPG